MIIDIHTHAFPDTLASRALDNLCHNAAQYADIYGDAHTYLDGTYTGLATSTAAAGLDLSVMMPIATSPKPSFRLNETAAEAARMPGLLSFGTVHPNSPDALEELEHIKALGLPGIKLHPDYQDCFVDGDNTINVVRRATELGLRILLHAGEDIGFLPPFHCTPERVVRLCEATGYPPLILAHMGGYRLWEEVLATFPPLENLCVDTSHSIEKFPDKWPVYADIVRAMGTHRVLFGSDSPWSPQAETLAAVRRFLEEYHFSEEDSAAILGGNAQRILGL